MAFYAVSGLQGGGAADAPVSGHTAVNSAQKDSVEHGMMIADQTLDSFDAEKEGIEALQMVAAQQKQVVMTVVGGANPEIAIALALTSSIDAYAVELETLQKWTNGGEDAFDAALMEMFTEMQAEGISGVGYENMFQLVLLDVMGNAAEYGLDDPDFLRELGCLLEKTGSGNHNGYDYTPEQLGAMVNSIWGTIYNQIQNGKIPTNSLAYQAMSFMSGGNISSTPPLELSARFTPAVYMDPNNGGWITDDNNDICPMTRMVLLSSLNKEKSISVSDVNTILNGDKTEVDLIFTRETGMDAYDFLFSDKCPGWWSSYPSGGNGYPTPSGVSDFVDFQGTIQPPYLKELSSYFSPRELTEEDIAEVNRIGDQVKMIQGTLKYWIQICRDEQLAIARNI